MLLYVNVACLSLFILRIIEILVVSNIMLGGH